MVTGSQAINFNKQTSLAAYAQMELHVTPQLDIVGGARITKDHKTGRVETGPLGSIRTIGVFDYKKTKRNFLIGVSSQAQRRHSCYMASSRLPLLGGSVSGLNFEPETATSWEAGIRADLLDNKLRTNLSLFHVPYKNFQTSQSGSNFPSLFPSPPFPAGFSHRRDCHCFARWAGEGAGFRVRSNRRALWGDHWRKVVIGIPNLKRWNPVLIAVSHDGAVATISRPCGRNGQADFGASMNPGHCLAMPR